MNNSPDISVIIPIYNTGALLQETINSVLNQTFKNFELLLINDGSNDLKTLEIINSQTDNRIKIINQINSGVAVSRNRGIAEAKGQYLAFLDHDDLFLPEKLTNLKSIMDKDSEIIMTYSSIIPFGDLSKPLFKLPIVQNLTPSHLISRNYIYSMSCVMCRKNLIEKYQINFDNACVPCDDWDFHIQCAIHGKIICADKPLIQYRLHADNQSNDLIKMYVAGNHVIRKNLQKLPQIAESSNFSKRQLRKSIFKTLSIHYYGLAYQYIFVHHNLLKGAYNLLKTYRYAPFSFKISKYIFKKLNEKLQK